MKPFVRPDFPDWRGKENSTDYIGSSQKRFAIKNNRK
jgi:hypothetical protein